MQLPGGDTYSRPQPPSSRIGLAGCHLLERERRLGGPRAGLAKPAHITCEPAAEERVAGSLQHVSTMFVDELGKLGEVEVQRATQRVEPVRPARELLDARCPPLDVREHQRGVGAERLCTAEPRASEALAEQRAHIARSVERRSTYVARLRVALRQVACCCQVRRQGPPDAVVCVQTTSRIHPFVRVSRPD